MKEEYKGYEIEITKGQSFGGWDSTYFTVFRMSDDLEVICQHTEEELAEEEMIDRIKARVDTFIRSKGRSELLEEWF